MYDFSPLMSRRIENKLKIHEC